MSFTEFLVPVGTLLGEPETRPVCRVKVVHVKTIMQIIDQIRPLSFFILLLSSLGLRNGNSERILG